MNSDATITFLANKYPSDPLIPPGESLFSIPYSKILQAQEFCKDEELEYCFVGYRDYAWYVNGIPDGLEHAIKVTNTGIHKEVNQTYIYCLTKDK
jgi:hypothetical protein